MARQTARLNLIPASPGTTRTLTVHRYGAEGNRPKAYLQASLHADETPGMLVLHHLLRLLDEAGAINGEIVIVPYANPIGLAQYLNLVQVGRYDLAGGGNFNRNWPDLFSLVVDKLTGRLTGDPAHNVGVVRSVMREALETMRPASALDSLRLLLAQHACDADFVLDLHCDDEALIHLFLIPAHWPDGQDLAAELGCRAVLLADPSGGEPFDEAFSAPWTRLAKHFPGHPIPPACMAATVELRGQADVSDELAKVDARALFRFMQRRGLIAGDPGPMPDPGCEATPFDAVDTAKAPAAGILAYRVPLGAQVDRGETIAELVDPAADDPTKARTAVRAATTGLVLSRRTHKYVAPGMSVAKIVGTRTLDHRKGGYLLED